MSGFNKYAANVLGDIKDAAGDLTRHAIADIGDSYQEVLMSDASVTPPDGLTGTMETVTTEADIAPEPVPPEPDLDIE